MMTILEEKVCEISWKEFWIEDVCEIKSGVRLTKANQEIGLRPFVGASDSDNGVTSFVSNKNKSLDANVLGVNYMVASSRISITPTKPFFLMMSND